MNGFQRRFSSFALPALAGLMALTPATVSTAWAQEPAIDVREHYVKSEHMVPMRDGVRLFTIIYEPRDTTEEYPIILFRTPYSVAPYGPDAYKEQLGPSPEFDRDGYIFVFQDVRGKYESEGKFQVIEPLYEDPDDPDEASDTYDTIEWLLDDLGNHNGRVGQWGISYAGWETVMGMAEAHPALAASSPQASPSDMFIGDDWHHNGAFRIMYAFSWLSRNASTVEASADRAPGPFDYGTPWGYRFFLEGGSAAAIDETYFHGGVPAWTDFIEHPTYDAYWKDQNALQYLGDIGDHPVLNVAGWFDAEDFYGPMSIYRTIEQKNPGNRSTLAVGPWLHGGWARMRGDHLGCVDFESATSRHFQTQVQYPFFRYYLKGEGDWSAPEAVVFETGSNEWEMYESWPPKDAEPTPLYFRAAGKLSFEPPPGTGTAADGREGDGAASYDEWVSDPNKPVPFSSEIRTSQGHLWRIEDQRFAATRPDVMVYETDVLERDVTIAGETIAALNVSTTGTDSDWIVKLIDVYPGDAPDGEYCETPMGDFQMLVAGEIMRGKFRKSYESPEPMKPGVLTEVEFSLRDRYHTFKKGHRIMVQVQSTWFPVYDRNPQRFMDIYRARPEDYRKATQRLYRAPGYASHILLPLLSERVAGTH